MNKPNDLKDKLKEFYQKLFEERRGSAAAFHETWQRIDSLHKRQNICSAIVLIALIISLIAALG